MKKNIFIAFAICTLLVMTGRAHAQCGQTGTTATCQSISTSSSLVSYSDYYSPGVGVPVTFYIDLIVYQSGGFAAMEVDWGYSGMQWDTLYEGEAHYSIPISSSENNNGSIWLSTAAVQGNSKARAVW